MKTQSFPKLLLYVVLCCTIVVGLGLMAGCKGDNGSNGAPGAPGLDAPTTGTVSGTVKTAVGAVPLAGVTVTASPAAAGGTATTDASGAYSMSIPGGSYTLTFAKTNYTSATANVNVANSVNTPANATLAEAASGKPSVALAASGNDVGYGQKFTLTASATSPLGATLSYTWTGTDVSSGATATATSQTFVSATGGTPAPVGDPYGDVPAFKQDNRFGVLPINADTRGTKSVSVTANDGQGGSTSVSVSVNSAAPQAGVRQVAVGIPVFMNAGSGAATTAVWTVSPPSGSTVTALSTAGTNTRNAWFIPDVEGAYVVSNGQASMTVYAGKFTGAISGGGYTTKTFSKNDPKAGMFFDTSVAYWWGGGVSQATYTNWPTVTQASTCALCHNDSSNPIALNVWTSWQNTAHATFFSRGIEGITSNNQTCVACHTVGSDGVNVGNNGYDDMVAKTGFVYAKGIGAWSAMTTSYPTVAAVANIQCENCHGAQGTVATGHTTAGTGGGSSYVSNETSTTAARVSFSADVCGSCHASGTGHHIYSEWNTLNPDTGNGHSKLAQIDATGYGGHARSTDSSCVRCHTAQGFSIYVNQLASGNAGTIPPSSIKWDQSNAQVQTCTACHDPHDVSNENQLRIYGSVQNTMAGFGVDGVGKGALCMVCHNNRNGVQCASSPTPTGGCVANGGALSPTGQTFLHEDTDAYAKTALDTMHDASQADVLMGRNFFFMGDNTAGNPALLPMISKHANVEDTCVGCHMALNPRTHLSHGTPAVNTHNFFIADADVPTLCNNCHGTGSVDGEALQTFVEDQLAILGQKMSANLLSRLVGTVYVNKVQLASFTTVTYFDGTFYVTATSPTNTTVRGSVTNITTDSAGQIPLMTPDDILKKASWNWTMIERDGSGGIHNPTLIQQVLSRTIAAF